MSHKWVLNEKGTKEEVQEEEGSKKVFAAFSPHIK